MSHHPAQAQPYTILSSTEHLHPITIHHTHVAAVDLCVGLQVQVAAGGGQGQVPGGHQGEGGGGSGDLDRCS